MVKSCGRPHQFILNLFLVAAQYNFFIVIVVLCFSTPKFSYVTQNGVVATIGVVRKFSWGGGSQTADYPHKGSISVIRLKIN